VSSGRKVQVRLGEPDRQTGELGVIVDTPFNGGFVEDLKDLCEYPDRKWFPKRKVWWISATFESDVVALVVYYYGETMLITDDGDEVYLDETGEEVGRQTRLL